MRAFLHGNNLQRVVMTKLLMCSTLVWKYDNEKPLGVLGKAVYTPDVFKLSRSEVPKCSIDVMNR